MDGPNRDVRRRNRILMALLWAGAVAWFLFILITKYLAASQVPS